MAHVGVFVYRPLKIGQPMHVLVRSAAQKQAQWNYATMRPRFAATPLSSTSCADESLGPGRGGDVVRHASALAPQGYGLSVLRPGVRGVPEPPERKTVLLRRTGGSIVRLEHAHTSDNTMI